MQYIALIYDSEHDRKSMSPADREQYLAAYQKFTADVKAAGVYVAGDALHPVETATTVRLREGKTLMTDGPFAETKEQLGGYYLLDCKDLDEALHWAAQIPTAEHGSIEVRPIMVW